MSWLMSAASHRRYSKLSMSQKEGDELSRDDFPSGFCFGVSTSAYQIEGAAYEGGKGLSIWDTFSHISGKVRDGTNGDVACDHYHRYKEDIQLLKDLGVDAYRFSLSWARILPDGAGELNWEGISFYNHLIDGLLQAGIEPYVTIFHWDFPEALESNVDIQGWLKKEIVNYFANYADICFQLFGDRVKNWITFNEIGVFALDGYGNGKKAPGRCSLSSANKLGVGDSSTEPYIVVHNALLSHAAAVKVYRQKFQSQQKGRISLVLNGKWHEPYTDTKEDINAAHRCMEFQIAWLLDPLFGMDYPQSMRKGAGNRLPSFTDDELKDLKGSLDYICFNYYTANYGKNSDAATESDQRWYETDKMATSEVVGADGKLIGERIGPQVGGWIYNCPWGLPKILAWLEMRYGKDQFSKLPFLITENGAQDLDWDLSFDEACNDWKRVEYLKSTLQALSNAIKDHGYNVKGYFVWSIMDNFEWNNGLQCRYGLYYVDFVNDSNRHPKRSSEWYQQLLGSSSRKTKSRCCMDSCEFFCSPYVRKMIQSCQSHWLSRFFLRKISIIGNK